MKWNQHTRRGLSSIVASAMLLTATAVSGSYLVAWSKSNLFSFETVIANSYSNMTNQIKENLVIENIQFCYTNCPNPNSHPGINATLTNTGILALTISQVQLNSSGYSTSLLPVTIVPKASYTLSINKTWSHNSPTTLTFTTKRGDIFSTQAIAP